MANQEKVKKVILQYNFGINIHINTSKESKQR